MPALAGSGLRPRTKIRKALRVRAVQRMTKMMVMITREENARHDERGSGGVNKKDADVTID